MNKVKRTLLKCPEYYLVLLALVTGYSYPFSFHPFFIGLATIPILQIVFKNRITGLLLGIVFSALNLYMLGALISEFSEFTEFSNRAKKLLFVGLSIWSLNMLVAATLIYKYSRTEIEGTPQLV